MKQLLHFFLMIFSLNLTAQFSLINEDGSDYNTIENYEVEKLDNQKLRKENETKDFSALTFAKAIDVNIDCVKDGSWESIPNNRLLWRQRIQSPGATSINLAFDKYIMPRGGYMIIFTVDKQYMAGPFTDFDNKTNGQLWSPIIPYDDIIIQIVIPNKSLDQLQLSIGKINHGFLESRQKSLSQSCNLDVICGIDDGFPEVENYRDVIRSVGVYSIEGTLICSGALVNNAKNNCLPYFLTADHCGITENNASSVVVHWKFENQICRDTNSVQSGGNGDGRLDIFNTGAKIVASNPLSDMVLLELDADVPVEADPHFAGWNNSSNPSSSAVVIHHPNTDEKRISFDNDPITVYEDEDVFWYVENWEIGTTEGGSSGAPLFNPDQQIIGQVFGGEASCGNGLWDIFGRFDISWEGDGSPKGSLNSWLDPDNTGISQLQGKNCSAILSISDRVVSICNQINTEYSITLSANNGFSSVANLSYEVDGNSDGISISFADLQIGPDQSITANISVDNSAAQGEYEIKFVADEAITQAITFITLHVSQEIPNMVTRISPDEAATVGTQITLQWVDDFEFYDMELSKNPNFNSLVFSQKESSPNFYELGNLDQETEYYWRVRGINACGTGIWSNFTFETGKIECTTYTASDLPKIITEDDRNTVISTINIPTNQAISDVNIISIIGTHSWVGDLQFRLESPSGKEIILLNQECERATNFHVGFDDSAETTFTCPLADSMSHIPDGSLSIFIDELSGGDWKLKVLDLEEFDGGSFDSWTIEVCTNVSKNSVSTEDLSETKFKVYPNPARDVIFLKLEDNVNKGSYLIHDAIGSLRQKGNLERAIEINDLENGIYFLQIRDGTRVLGIEKIIISK